MRVGVIVALLVIFAVLDATSVAVPKARQLLRRARDVQAGLDAARAKNEARMAALRANKAGTNYRDRFGSEPYLKLHGANEQVKGTVVVFHGFSGMPVQQNPLVEYLFNQGYDVFDASVAGHYRVNVPGPEVSFPGSDHLKAAGLSPLTNTFVAWPYPDYGRDPIADYTREVETTWDIMKTLRSPFFAAGLSAGAVQALGIAAAHPEIKRVAAFAPLLDLEPAKKKQLTTAAQLITASRELPGSPKAQWDGWFAWDKSNPFPQGCFWALQKYGQRVARESSRFKSNKQQLFLVTTANEDAADSAATQSFFNAVGGAAAGNVYYSYAAAQKVPHPINALDARSQGMINFYYKTLFQETARFFASGAVKSARLGVQDLNPQLPGYTEPAKMDWDVNAFGGSMGQALPAHVDLWNVK